MRRSLLALLALAASCGGRLSPTENRAGAVSPTRLTDEQRARDAAIAPAINALLDAYSNGTPVLSPDGERFLFRSNRGGTSELYLAEIAHPEGAPRKLVSGPERVMSAIFTADGRTILFRQDHGADENFHIFRVALDGSGRVDLTPGEELWRDSPLLPRKRTDLMIYGARKTSDNASMIVVQDLAGGAPKVVYRDRYPGTALDVAPDGSAALWIREALAGGHELFEIDLVNGAARLLSPAHGGPATATAAAYSTDGERLFVADEGEGESHRLRALDRRSLATLAEYRQESPATANVHAIVPSPRGDRVAIAIDAGNRSTVRLLDATTLAVRAEVQTPLGTVTLGADTEVRYPLGGGTFSPDGKKFAIGLSVPDAPDDVWLVDSESGAIAPLRHDARAGLDRLPPIVASIEGVRAFDGLTIPVNLYLPRDGATRLPTLVDFHGGPDASTPLSWSAWTRLFIRFGFAVVEPNVRGSTGFGRAWEIADDREKRADSLRDVESVNRWARTQPWCDPDRLIVEGGSYGGYLTLMALTRQPSLWAAGVDLAGFSDLTTFLDGATTRYLTEFGDPKKDAKLLAEFSPLRAVDKIIAPLFVYQGQNDHRVPRGEADQMVREVRRRNIPVEYMVAMNEGHTVAHRENQVEFLARMLRFLHDQLKIR